MPAARRYLAEVAKMLHHLVFLSLVHMSLCNLPVASTQGGPGQLGAGPRGLHTVPVAVDVTGASLWRCPHPGQAKLNQLRVRSQELRMDIVSVTELWVEIIWSNSDNDSIATELARCKHLAHLSDLIAQELRENWETFRHHTNADLLARTHSVRGRVGRKLSSIKGVATDGGHIVRRAVAETERPDSGCREGVCKESNSAKDEWFTRYHNLSTMYQWYRELAEQHPLTVTINDSIGKTHYDRDIMALHITDHDHSGAPEERVKIYIQCLLHAREWISGSVCMYLSRYLATPDTEDNILAELLTQLEFIIVPVANPDGYYLTWLQYPKYRLWRKNVSPVEGTKCAGVDLNRNFDIHWNEEDSSMDPCSELYSGPSAASEQEVQAITRYIQSNSPVQGAIDFHSYYQEVLYPPASTKKDPKNVQTLKYVAEWVAAAASQVGEKYVANKMNDIYLASGTFPDWMLSRLGVGEAAGDCIIPLTVELRPAQDAVKPYTGFLLPSSEILPCCREMVPAVVKFAQLVVEKCR